MKKQKLKLGLTKMNISNLQNLHAVKGGNGSVQLCTEGNCGPTVTCDGYVCGETLTPDCGIDNTLNPPCISDVTCTTFYVDTCANTYPHTNGCFPVTE